MHTHSVHSQCVCTVWFPMTLYEKTMEPFITLDEVWRCCAHTHMHRSLRWLPVWISVHFSFLAKLLNAGNSLPAVISHYIFKNKWPLLTVMLLPWKPATTNLITVTLTRQVVIQVYYFCSCFLWGRFVDTVSLITSFHELVIVQSKITFNY